MRTNGFRHRAACRSIGLFLRLPAGVRRLLKKSLFPGNFAFARSSVKRRFKSRQRIALVVRRILCPLGSVPGLGCGERNKMRRQKAVCSFTARMIKARVGHTGIFCLECVPKLTFCFNLKTQKAPQTCGAFCVLHAFVALRNCNFQARTKRRAAYKSYAARCFFSVLGTKSSGQVVKP